MAVSEIDDRVKDVVRAWGGAKHLEAAADALRRGRSSLPPDLRPQLVSEIAEISAELMVTVLCKPEGLDDGRAPVEVEGEALHPRQAERLGAWLEDQKLAADALGLDVDAWLRELDKGFTRFGARAGGDETGKAVATFVDPEQARRLLGAARSAFEARPDAGSEKAGLSGLLAARSFGKKKR